MYVTPDKNPLCKKTYTSCHWVIMTSFDPPQKEVWHSEQKPTVCKNKTKTKNKNYCPCVIVMSLWSSTERGTYGNRLCVRNLHCVVIADIIVTPYQKYTYLCDIKIQHLPEWYQNKAFTCMKIQHLPVWCQNTALICLIPKYSTYLCDTKIQHLPVWYLNTALTCVISKYSTDLCDIKIQHLPVWKYSNYLRDIKLQQLLMWYQATALTCAILNYSTYLCDIKVQYFLHVGGQTGEHAVESPVVGEMSHCHGPYRWWRRNLTPGSRDTLKRGGSVCLKVHSHNHSRFI